MSDITKELTDIKGLGLAKANAILDHVNDGGEVSVAAISAIKGISEDLAKKAVKVVKQAEIVADEPEPEPEVAEATEEVAVSTNGHAKHTAGEVRAFARTALDFGFDDLADGLFEAVARNLDDEPVEVSFG